MCSNYEPVKRVRNPWVREHFNVDLPDADWKEHTWPTVQAPFIFLDKGMIRCELGKFGIEPFWARSKLNFGKKTYNARSETAHDKPAFRYAWGARRFGLVLAEHFFEPLYKNDEKPVWAGIHRKDNEPTAIGCLWENYLDQKTNEIVRSFTMLTVNADEHPFMRQFHEPGKEKRSVVVVENGNFDKWLNATTEEVRELIKLPPHDYLEYQM